MEGHGKPPPARNRRQTIPDGNGQPSLIHSRDRLAREAPSGRYLQHATTFPGPSDTPEHFSARRNESINQSSAVDIPLARNGRVIQKPAAQQTTSTSKPPSRRPVERRTISEGTHNPTAQLPSSSSRASERSEHHLLPPPSTIMLFDEASRSLTDLTEGVNGVRIQDSTDDPPPYTDFATRVVPTGDTKRRNTLGDSGNVTEHPNAIQFVRENRLDLLQQMCEEGLSTNDVDPTTRRTAMMEAASLRRIAAARILVAFECRLHLKDRDGWTALHFSSYQGDVEMCHILLEAGAQLDEYNNAGETPLSLAARGGYTDVVQCLLNSWASQMSSGTALLNGFLEASKSGNVRTAELFVERGIQPRKIKDSWRPVCFAASSGSIPMIDFMLAHKCNIKQRNSDGANALHFAAQAGHTGMVEKLLALNLNWRTQTNSNQETALHLATFERHHSTTLALLHHKNANITMRDSDGVQPLHHCARNGDMMLATTLLNRGAKLDDQTRYGWTPMLLVCAYGHLPLVAEFITRGVSLEERLATPSFRPREKTNEAARKGYWAEIRWPHPGARPLHLALEFSHDEVANTLIAAGAKLEEPDSEGWRPLHYAAFNARVHMVEMLLNRGASPHATTNMGNTPLKLGFREPGLDVSYEVKLQIHDLLQAAMHARKKSKLRQLSDAMKSPSERSQSREVSNRNKIWLTAQLAEALYQNDRPGEEVDEGEPKLTTTTSNQLTIDDDDDDDSGYGESRTSERNVRITKSMTD